MPQTPSGASRGSLRRISGNLCKVGRRENSGLRHSMGGKGQTWWVNSASLYKLAEDDCNGSGSRFITLIGCENFGALESQGAHTIRAQQNSTGSRNKSRWLLQGKTRGHPITRFLSFLAWLLISSICYPALHHSPPHFHQRQLSELPAPRHSLPWRLCPVFKWWLQTEWWASWTSHLHVPPPCFRPTISKMLVPPLSALFLCCYLWEYHWSFLCSFLFSWPSRL